MKKQVQKLLSASIIFVLFAQLTISLETVSDDMAYIPEGNFTMGSDKGFNNEKPERKVFVKAFYIDKYEVTNEQYKKFIDSTKYQAPKNWANNTYPAGKEKYPVVNVSYLDAEKYAQWAKKRLPTEEEWEKAARGTDGRKYPWGNVWEKEKSNCYDFLGNNSLKPVGSFETGVSPYNCHDMSGNAWEWTDTWYKMVSQENNKLNEKYKIIKGGSWLKSNLLARCSVKEALPPNDTYGDVGFRCVK